MRAWRGTMVVPLVLLLWWGCGGPRGEAGEADEAAAAPAALRVAGDRATIVLDSATRARMGIRVAPLSAARGVPERAVPAVVVPDPGAGSAVRAGIGGRLAALPDRAWPRVGERLEAGELVAQVGDARPLAAPASGTVVRLLAQPGELVQAGQLLLELVDFSAPLAQVAWGGRDAPGTLPFRPLAGGARITGALVGPAPEADPLTRGPAVLYRLRGGAGLRPGGALQALVPDPDVPGGGVTVPAAAVVQWDALAWVYREAEPGSFTRVRVATDHPVPDGWRVPTGLVPGDRVVIAGAGQLLSEEFRARIVVGEEVGE